MLNFILILHCQSFNLCSPSLGISELPACVHRQQKMNLVGTTKHGCFQLMTVLLHVVPVASDLKHLPIPGKTQGKAIKEFRGSQNLWYKDLPLCWHFFVCYLLHDLVYKEYVVSRVISGFQDIPASWLVKILIIRSPQKTPSIINIVQGNTLNSEARNYVKRTSDFFKKKRYSICCKFLKEDQILLGHILSYNVLFNKRFKHIKSYKDWEEAELNPHLKNQEILRE